MPSFSTSSMRKLSTTHPDLQRLFFEVVRTFDCRILEGNRGQEAQEKAVEGGFSKLHYPQGKHNALPSLAVDVSPYPIDWKNNQRFYWFAGYVIGIAQKLKDEGKMQHSIRWGGDWNRNFDITDENGLRDLVHYEIIT